MTDRTDDWRTIFGDLTDSSGCYEMGRYEGLEVGLTDND